MSGNLITFIDLAVQLVFFVLLLVFCVHTLVLSYHWFNYGTSRKTATTALAMYLIGGALSIGTMAATLLWIV